MKKVLVSGGSSGIGQGIAIHMARTGWEVTFTYRTHPEGAEKTKRAIEAFGGTCHVLEAHLEEEGAPERMVREAIGCMGGLDAFVSNAAGDGRHSILTTTRAEMQRLVSSNFLGYLMAAGECARYMVRSEKRGSIVFITSTRAISPHPDDFLYGGLKAAIERAAESMALDLSPYGIRVNCIEPGATLVRPWQTHDAKAGEIVNGHPYWPIEDTIPLGRMGKPEDVAYLAEFLCSEKSSYITGEKVRIDGGLSLPGMPEWSAPCEWMSPEWRARQREEMEKTFPAEGRDV
ncbi:MAG: SDR family oxidoreductase [Clostridia bacterium]|nr:SDR family oxidoreductase [Clostridia bacterium]